MNFRICFPFTGLALLVLFLAGSCSQPAKDTKTTQLGNVANEQPRLRKTITIKANSDAGGGPYTLIGDLAYASWSPATRQINGLEMTVQNYCISTSPNVEYGSKSPLIFTEGTDSFEICFTVNENKRFDQANPVSPGTYYWSRDTSGMSKLGQFTFRIILNNKEAVDLLSPDHTFGPLKIDTALPDRIAGSIAMSDQTYSINGEFDSKVNKH